MIAVDTNILVRFLTKDDKEQGIKVEHLFRQHAGEGDIFVATLVILEMNWVLTSLYAWKPARFYDAVEDILSCPSFTVENDIKVRDAVTACRTHSKLDFSDALIGYAAAHRGLITYTFDKKLRTLPIFHVL